ncbi:Fe(3+) dicitrate ABC transporter ATP-binding protein FecE [Algicola sagamiensis]|uniref:Fe(3+) dicitrate ABC transporter ATP-binding protein FecE n=1 Tax=Algicola sagamiensis TaxID=163869 RepID=UPI0003816F2C|nr:Fe(3+) dicitrate ABC transporter ATP-binding protein FecE [Algicola sagamiensis]
MMLSAKNLTVGYGDRTILNDLSIDIPSNKVTAFIGPNGCGKSTLLKTLSRVIQPKHGSIELDGKSFQHYSEKQLAKKISLLPQVLHAPEGMTVRKLVTLGRTPYLSFLGRLSEVDHEHVTNAIKNAGVEAIADHFVDALSGGQRQRVWIAMILAQDTPIVMLDEPTTYLDLSHQVALMQLIRAMNNQGKTVVTVLHDLNQACRYCDHLIVMKDGKVITQGMPEAVMNRSLLKSVFDLDAEIFQDPIAQSPMCVSLF